MQHLDVFGKVIAQGLKNISMKTTKSKMLLAAAMLAGATLITIEGKSQDRKLPDGTIIYSDGTRRLPNGTIIYKDGTKADRNNTNVILPDGTVAYPDGTRRHKGHRRVNANARSLPPGQAKKIYGGSATDYAPGQQKKWHGKKGKGHKH